jgi:uncharacterized protein YidB (DUF937 family)
MDSRWVYLALGCVIGGAAGVWWSPRAKEVGVVSATTPHVTETDAVPPAREVRPPEANAEPGRHSASDPLFAVRQLTMLKKGGMAYNSVQILEGSEPLSLSPAFRQMFAVTPTEEDRLLQAVATARAGVHQLEAALAQAGPGTGEDEGAWVVKVPAFPAEAARLHDTLMDQFMQTLGSERAMLLNELYGQQLEALGDQFGGRERRVVIRRGAVLDDGRVIYEWQDHFQMIDSKGYSGSSGIGRDSVVRSLKHLAPYLPPNL